MNRSGQKLMLLSLFLVIAVFLSVSVVVVAAVVAEDDVRCLQGLTNAFKDPQGKLDSWTFSDHSVVGFICKFTGATCWNERENRLISLLLPSMDLVGKLPASLQYCGSIQNLDLSGNRITGTIPSDICDWMPYLVTLDLSSNDLSGPIPPELVKCKFLNNLLLGNNGLSGPIPDELASLKRLNKFSVVNNDLTGQIPSFLPPGFDPADFEGNSGLCGKPLDVICRRGTELGVDQDVVILGIVVYFVVTVVSSWGWYWLLFAEIKRKNTPNSQRASRETRGGSSILPS